MYLRNEWVHDEVFRSFQKPRLCQIIDLKTMLKDKFFRAGKQLEIEQRLRESVGAVVWEAALVLSRFLGRFVRSGR